ncbi:MAG TPA: hypothetical protein VFD75_02720 [Pyrinomonadaceae bacterium]|nr:hypothetical protein [Pyrinomonadaceae bacterium]
MEFAQVYDRVEIDGQSEPLDVSGLRGVWINSNPDTNGIARMEFSESNGKLSVRVDAIGPDGLIDWGLAPVKLFAASPKSRATAGFTCNYDFGFAETRLQAMIMKGLIVLAQFHEFKDDSGRMDFFVREYFAVVHDRY